MKLTPSSNFDDIAPLNEQDIPNAIQQLLEEPKFVRILTVSFPTLPIEVVKAQFRSITTVGDFQQKIARPFLRDLEAQTSNGIYLLGTEQLSVTQNYLFLSNHRDITLDASYLCVKLLEKGFDTVEVAVGNNLLLESWIETLVRLNKSFIVQRGLRGRAQLEASRHLSDYIHYAIKNKHQSVWLAQREGRAKDSNDRTQESLLKMLAMSGDQSPVENLASLAIRPLIISYEYDPCDFLKAKELQQRRDDPCFQKSPKDDLISMETGITGFKGKVVYKIGKQLSLPVDRLHALPRSEQFSTIAKLIDQEIHQNYQIYNSNKVAFDQLFPDQKVGEYTLEEQQQFDYYIQAQIAKIDLEHKDEAFLKQKLLEIYANPLINYREAIK